MARTKLFAILFAVLAFLAPAITHAQGAEIIADVHTTAKAEVLEVVSQERKQIPGTDTESIYQTIRIKVLEGAEAGKEISIENDHLKLEEGDLFYLLKTTSGTNGESYYSVGEPYRLPALGLFTFLFVLAVVGIGGKQGVRGLLALLGSLAIIGWLLIPGIFAGYSPLVLSTLISSLIILIGSYITHGVNKATTAAVLGMIATILLTSVLAFWAVDATHLSGFETEESVYLNFNTRGAIDFSGLLLGGIMIGLLGVLYDVAIGQSVAVDELHHAAPHLSRKTVYARAQRIGREHIGALVNTLAIAYVGVSLPLLLLFYGSESTILTILNREVFATELVRILIGSIGLVLAVPITTAISVAMIVKSSPGGTQASHRG